MLTFASFIKGVVGIWAFTAHLFDILANVYLFLNAGCVGLGFEGGGAAQGCWACQLRCILVEL